MELLLPRTFCMESGERSNVSACFSPFNCLEITPLDISISLSVCVAAEEAKAFVGPVGPRY